MSHQDLRSLEEQLAARFHALIPRHEREFFRPWDSLGHAEREPLLVYAREALRLAEWARFETARASIAVASGSAHTVPPLSLPPDSFKA